MIWQADCAAALVELPTSLGAMRGRRGEPADNEFVHSAGGAIDGTKHGDLLSCDGSRVGVRVRLGR